MSEAYEYGDEEFDDEEPLSEEDRIRMEIMDAEEGEIWLEEPGDEDDEAPQMPSPLFGLFPSIPSFPNQANNTKENKDRNDEDTEH